MALVGIGLANFWSGCVTRNVLFSTGLTPRAGQGGGREWVDPRWDMENNHPKKKEKFGSWEGGVISLVGAWLFLLLLKL